MPRPRPPLPPATVSVVDAVAATVDGVREVHPAHGSLVAIAFRLAQQLDAGAGMAAAAIATELRATLDEILREEEQNDELEGFLAGLSSPVGDRKEP